jgi:hypothetical protein
VYLNAFSIAFRFSKALSYGERVAAVKKFVTEEKLATMLGEDAPAPGAIDKCADAISDLSR